MGQLRDWRHSLLTFPLFLVLLSAFLWISIEAQQGVGGAARRNGNNNGNGNVGGNGDYEYNGYDYEEYNVEEVDESKTISLIQLSYTYFAASFRSPIR